MTDDFPTPPDDFMRAVVLRYELPLTQYAARITGCRERARDAVQDTFVRLGKLPPGTLTGDRRSGFSPSAVTVRSTFAERNTA